MQFLLANSKSLFEFVCCIKRAMTIMAALFFTSKIVRINSSQVCHDAKKEEIDE
jgi:hypothetical protein